MLRALLFEKWWASSRPDDSASPLSAYSQQPLQTLFRNASFMIDLTNTDKAFKQSIFGITTLTAPAILYLWICIPLLAVSLLFTIFFPWAVRRFQKYYYPLGRQHVKLPQNSFTMLGDELPDSADVPRNIAMREGTGLKKQKGVGKEKKYGRSRSRSRVRGEKERARSRRRPEDQVWWWWFIFPFLFRFSFLFAVLAVSASMVLVSFVARMHCRRPPFGLSDGNQTREAEHWCLLVAKETRNDKDKKRKRKKEKEKEISACNLHRKARASSSFSDTTRIYCY